jgi:hypothetical protein
MTRYAVYSGDYTPAGVPVYHVCPMGSAAGATGWALSLDVAHAMAACLNDPNVNPTIDTEE